MCGIYIDKNTIRGTGYILVNGGTPDDITTTKPELEKVLAEENKLPFDELVEEAYATMKTVRISVDE